MGVKGSWPRPRSTTREERQLRDDYMNGRCSLRAYYRAYNGLLEQGLIQRNGRIIKKD